MVYLFSLKQDSELEGKTNRKEDFLQKRYTTEPVRGM